MHDENPYAVTKKRNWRTEQFWLEKYLLFAMSSLKRMGWQSERIFDILKDQSSHEILFIFTLYSLYYIEY